MRNKISWIKSWFFNLGLYQMLMVTFCCIFFPAILVVLLTSTVITGKIAMKNYNSYAIQFLDDLSRNIEYITTDVETKSRFILSEDVVQSMLSAQEGDRNYNDFYRRGKEELTRLILEQGYIESLSVYSFSGNGFTVGDSPSYLNDSSMWMEQEWYQEMLDKRGGYIWKYCDIDGINGKERRLILGRVINKTDTMEGLGFMIFVLDNHYIEKLVSDLSSPTIGSFYIINNKNELLFSPGEEKNLLHFSMEKTDESKELNTVKSGKFLITRSDFMHLDWSFVCVGDILTVLSNQWINFCIILLAALCIMIAAAFVYSKFSHSVTKEIQRLNSVMENAEKKNFKEEIRIERIQEFIQLSSAYNRLTKRIHILINQVMKEKLNTKQAQLENLQAQINPHFLYNTLDCINWKAMANGQEEISQMIQSLSRMFRFSLGKGEKEVNLEKEVENVRNYLLLQKKRFEDKLIYLIDIPEEVMEYKVIKFFLQPLVENSILHGIQTRTEKGYVGITAKVEDELLVISIWDNGVGIDKASIEKILEGSSTGENKKFYGHGIYNVNERLKMRYGIVSALHFENRKNGGTKVTIRIPLDKM